MSKQYAFYFDSSACSGCKACQVACKDKHDLEVGRLWRRVYEVTGGEWRQLGDAWVPDLFAYYLSIACNHCQKPICAEVCPARAISRREDGIVLLDPDKCLGCGYCSYCCPYGALQYDRSAGHMSKCTFCVDEIDGGRSPACVTACPMRVLDFGHPSALEARYGASNGSHPLPEPHLTKPSLMIKPHKDAHRSQDKPLEVAPGGQVDKEEWPLIAFTLLSQMAVGAFLVSGVLRSPLAQKGGVAAHPTGMLAYPTGMLTHELLSGIALLLIGPLMILGMLFSLLHLGKPRSAYRALTNIRSSWLSREVLFATFFAASGAVYAGMQWLKIGSFEMRGVLAWIVTLLGLALVYSMSRVYTLSTVPTWNTLATPLSFFSTSLLLGSLAVGLLILSSYVQIPGPAEGLLQGEIAGISRGLALALLVLFIVECLVFRLQLAGVRRGLAATRAPAEIPQRTRNISRLRLVLTLLGVGMMGILLYQPTLISGRVPLVTALVPLAFGLVLGGEVVGRYLFYKMYARYGV